MKKPDPAKARAAVLAIADWIAADSPEAARAAGITQPSRSQLADAVRHTARLLAADAPGHSVELRVPPFVAVQCIEGPRHTRGVPPNVVEASPHAWLRLATGHSNWDELVAQAGTTASGTRAGEIAQWMPIIKL
ncbi:sterol carrier family protein [Corynebacterium pseudodiphtheriticum]|uniref:sterol carrier family protein n=1 Tax=Corynebacterium pseudodiphtheriticum TaxID=37637 RepID=UPI00223BF1C6|nr:sterol carrier family protein [Corynebacterium pseudodiphtheriticum]MCT1635961.1 sterol carrier family protein [Corynebacterium pseudodiphtheriticum]MCT1667121.1 sterol carrier family protein [Corynebacterium pseudodiphtheriticum]WKS30653.1 sterol carrier family protein [Corynebacterium pseudodiphtheriticum]WKS52080.1 sterol carrier family protein [Corynebacterium pseudodiphtheriticum]